MPARATKTDVALPTTTNDETQHVDLMPTNGIFMDVRGFEAGQRIAQALTKSDLVPNEYRNNLANCLVALDISQRLRMSPLLVMQNLHVIYGRPSWSSQFIIAAINNSGRFSPLRFEMTGTAGKDDRTCIATAIELATDAKLDGPPVSIGMSKAEGWYSRKDKNGKETSKWQTMPELMLRYRAAAFFGRLYAPEILAGLPGAEEAEDMIDVTPHELRTIRTGADAARALLSPVDDEDDRDDELRALDAIAQSNDVATLKELWVEIASGYEAEIPVQLEAAYRDRLEALKQQAEQPS